MRRFSLFPAERLTEESAVRRFYDRAADTWQNGLDRIGYGEAYRVLAQKAHGYAPTQASQLRILDVGCGTGALSDAFVQALPSWPELDLLDVSEQMLAQAQARLSRPTHAITGGVGSAQITEAHYDYLLCGHVVEHCDDPAAAFAWMFSRLRPGGTAVFAVSKPHWCTALIRWKYGSAAYRPEQVEAMLQDAGFTKVHRAPHESGPPSRVSCGYFATRPA